MSFFKPRKQKYGSTKTADGFPSKLESAVYALLVMREKAGEIRDLKRQQSVILQDGPRDVRITFRVDFSFVYCSTDRLGYAEAKGHETETYRLKLKLFRKNPPASLEIWKGNYKNPRLVEVINGPEDHQ